MVNSGNNTTAAKRNTDVDVEVLTSSLSADCVNIKLDKDELPYNELTDEDDVSLVTSCPVCSINFDFFVGLLYHFSRHGYIFFLLI